MGGLVHDLRYAFRQLRKSPGFAITATAMLAVAICANSTVFSWIDGTMLRPIPGARDTGDLVSLQRGERNFSPVPPLSYLDYRDLREQNHTFTGILAYHHDWITLTGGAQPERVFIANVSANYFDVLGIKPMLGRFFLPEEETHAVPNVVLSYSLWKTRYAEDRAIVGRSIDIARHPVTVIGVAPEGFVGAMPGLRDDLWVTLDPLGTDEWRITHRDGGAVWLNVIGRLRPGVSRDKAAQDLDTVMRNIVAAYPNEHLGANQITLDPMWRSPFGANGYMAATLPILLAFAAVVLLLTCANVATLTLVRFVSRRRELAIRQSLGANRIQLMRQMVLEGVALSIVAGAVALALTTWTSKTFAWFFRASSSPTTLNGSMDHNVVIGIAVFSLLASMLCGALPAWRSSHAPAVVEVLKAESASISGGSRNRKLLSGLVVAQIALSLPLLLCSGLFLRTLRNLASANPGFEQDHILTATVGLNIAGYSHDEVQLIRHKILDRVSALPGVKVASLTDWIPMTLNHKAEDAYPEGYVPHPHESLQVYHAEVGPRYFESLHIPILEGREFSPDDDETAPRVLIVDQTAARRYWPGQDPLGKNLRIWGRLFTVVGVARNSTHMLMNESPEPMVYMSFFQEGYETIVHVETEGNPVDMVPAVENAIHEIDTRLPVFDVRPMRESTQLASSFAVIQSTLAGMFALIGLVLAVTGIYGVVAYRTQMRTHEIGVRMAVGASRVDVLRLVLLQGVWLTGIGVALGLAFALGLTRVIARLLYGIGANDPVTMASVVMLLGAMSLLACYFPAHRAMLRNPVAAIREL
jgi:predicted permease